MKALFSKLKTLTKGRRNLNGEAKKEQLKNALALLFIALLSVGFYAFTKSTPAPKPKQPPAFDGVFDKSFNQRSDEALLLRQQHQIDRLTARMKKKEEKETVAPAATMDEETKALIKSMNEQLASLKEENLKINEKLQFALLKTTSSSSMAGIAARPPTKEEMEARKKAKLQQQRDYYAHAGLETVRLLVKKNKEEHTPDNYVWAGTFVEGVMLTGIIGDAGINGSKNMGTAEIRLDSNGIMPNNQFSHLKDCFALVSTYGDLSASSVVLHLETLSCAGKRLNFEQKVYGTVFDLDAMQDLRGTSVLKTKPLLNYTAAAGMLAGLGDGLKNYGSAQTINSNGSITTFSPRAIGQSAAGGAITNPANKISDYVMKIADLYHPLVVAKAGRRVSVLFTKGFWIDKEHQVYESGKAFEEAREEPSVTTTISRTSTESQDSMDANNNHEQGALWPNSEPAAEQVFLGKSQPELSEPLFSPIQKETTHG